MDLFNDELNDLPGPVQVALGRRLEEVVRMIYGRHNSALRDYTINHYTKEEISAMVFAIFDIAQRLKNPPE